MASIAERINNIFSLATFPNLISKQNPSSSSQWLSVTVIETIFCYFLLSLSILTPLTIVAQQFGIPFNIYVTLSLLVLILCMVAVAWIQKNSFKQIIIMDKSTLIGLFFLSLMCTILSFKTIAFNSDDYYYVPNAVYFLDHPTESMDFRIHQLIGSSDEPVISHNQGAALTFEYIRAVIAFYLHQDYLEIYYLLGNLLILLLPLAQFILITRFVNDPENALVGTIFSITLILISLNGNNFGRNAFFYGYHGKRFMLVAGIPLFTAFSISFFKRPTMYYWMLLFATTIALAGMTASTVSLIPALAVMLILSFFLINVFDNEKLPPLKTIILQVALYFSSLTYLFLYALFIFVQVKRGVASGNPFDVNPLGFSFHLNFFSPSSQFPLTLAIMVISPILLFIIKRNWQSNYIVFWAVLLFILFLNPISARYVIGTIVPGNIYWRLFYLAPFPLAAGITIAMLSFPRYSSKLVISIILLFTVVVYYVRFVDRHPGLELNFSIYDIPQQDLKLARQISAVAPEGNMLAPPNLYGLIPMIDGFHPQIRTREDGDLFWLNDKDRILREKVSKFVGGGGTVGHVDDFERLLKQNIVQTIVFKDTLFNMPYTERINVILQENKFIHRMSVDGYIVVWK